jgi:TolB protein
LPLTRLTSDPWDDITPSASATGSQVAFASNRDGQWDLYVLDIDSGDTTRLTKTAEYDAAPSLSPDGQYIVHESYVEGNLEIIIRDVKGELTPINLSKHPADDLRPAWSPRGRQVAFVSTRSGEAEIWIADLDKGDEERFTNLSQSPRSMETNPAWSPDGNMLSWASTQDGIRSIWIQRENGERHYAGSGDRPVWSPDGSTLLSTLETPNQYLLSAYTAQDSLLVLPPIILPGEVQGLAWLRPAPSPVLPEGLDQAAKVSPTPLWFPELTPEPDIPGNRHHLVPLVDVAAPYPQLHDMVDESFLALRVRVAEEAGWDLLATLENAYVPLTSPLAPGLGNDWLYSGRAFTLTPLPINAGWMVVVPEQFGFETYWRVYLKARFQDGSQGKPLPAHPWDLNARYSGDQIAYEQGGIPHENMPVGYWIDFTALASAYGWERLPALPNWQSLFPAARFNEFVHSGGQDWRSAMLELFPAEALVTPTIVPPPTQTATPTPRWYRTPTPTLTATSIPTLTPLSPTQTSPITPSP